MKDSMYRTAGHRPDEVDAPQFLWGAALLATHFPLNGIFRSGQMKLFGKMLCPNPRLRALEVRRKNI